MQPQPDGDYRAFIEKRQKEVSSPRSREAADKLWENSTEALDRQINEKYIGAKKKQTERDRRNQETLQRQKDFNTPGMGMIREVLQRKKSLKKKTPSPRPSPPPSSRPLLPPPPPSTDMTDEGKDVYKVLEKVKAFKSPAITTPKNKEDSGKTAARLDSKTLKSYLQDIKSRSGKSSRRKPRRRKPRRTNPSRGKPRRSKSSRGGRRKSRRRRGKK